MAIYKRRRYLLMTLDPVHIGTGGYRLGRVDNSIVREPGTRVPKIPGTSLHGAARSYAAQLYETPEAAGQTHDTVTNPEQNPVCYTFGYIKKNNNGQDVKAYSGVVNVFDAHIVLFPVHSLVGPVWVGTVERLREAGFEVSNVPGEWAKDEVLLTFERTDPLNLGWLMLSSGGQVTVNAPTKNAPTNWQTDRWNAIKNKIALVHESIFSHIVNSNLEVRTSVSINPETGAAEDKALFTYEAIPRATFLTAEVVLDDYRAKFEPVSQNKNSLSSNAVWQSPLDVLDAGLRLIEWLGVGGMGTRGFGRIAIVGQLQEENYGQQANAAHSPSGEGATTP
ncbi:MAG: type III-B CRISPR module RAMP protein Cmr4 [Roseiflexus sp.]|uniref:type III-B CRISPR module RAMP protein Cmr4 n=1 Tax=Roseiflexus sp. TaxID=2562120 RepID=UPI0025D6821D|nr:type III-B CRISPR module RAMP protein Cmr4 [Roseiflexus sp.]MCL6539932.1 type III-B CRISPR module RAMP protein Cmr4 [Roseiflexus sp.]